MTAPIRIAINGYGRIGRSVLRALQESKSKCGLDVVAINEPAADLETMAYLTRYDSTHGVFPGTVGHEGNALVIDGQPIAVRHVRDPEAADWASLDVDILLECSGRFGARAQLQRFLDAGCPRVLVSQPGNSASDVDYTVVFGVNDEGLSGRERIVSNASCTTNAIVPVLDELDRAYGVQHAFLTTLHSVMNDQPMIDGYHHADLRRTRSAMQSIVPVATGLAQGVERLLPKLAGKVQAKAIRVPILNVSAIDLMVKLGRDVTPEMLNTLMQDARRRHPRLIAYSDHPHASIDFNHDPHSAIIDGSQTRSNGDGFANLFIWFDNEWGFANRMLDVACMWAERIRAPQAETAAASA
ncbi:erythrose-4-phosphate dehydrogenase [Pusillimonas sp. TS35]|uniref:type I glyceraldehyde-3-phosphate dehydrogenase n=1 Tax=Paracandidimonas lactea TaxID=2895524 RepID=UPI00136BF0F8|nr:glyceraldehyde 3-phosphate dehydrogenase NAD-binding domain-containing protein [Paracandidimonas lactea]MYN12111.1 erythrose-4-phosphate dehydrogenase [Pusillimonas sp. TS35]